MEEFRVKTDCRPTPHRIPTWSCRLVGYAALAIGLASPVSGQTLGLKPSPKPSLTVEPTDQLGRTTPRGTIAAFIRASHREDFVSAARYMEVNEKQSSKTVALARNLRELMNRYFNEPLEAISDSPSGTLDDGLPLDRERVGPLRIGAQRIDIILVRVNRPEGWIWLISSNTLAQVPALYDSIEKSWVERVMPQMLLDYNFVGISLAQWVAGIVSLGLPLLLFWSFSYVFKFFIAQIIKNPSRSRILELWRSGLNWPLIFVITLTIHIFALSLLALSLGFRIVYVRFLTVLLVISVTWLLRRISKLSFEHARSLMERRHETETESLLLLAKRILGVLLTLSAIFLILTILGVDTKTALAGVGIGGVAVAFGAQKTVENLLGGIFLLTDKVLAVGDLCCISNRRGRIEDITLRSVRLRTLEQTLLSIPAGALSQANIENFATRQKILAQTTLRLRYGTTARQVRLVLEGIHKLLVDNRKVETETARIRLIDFGLSAIELELYAYVLTSDNMEFMSVREDLLLQIAEIVESAGTRFAGPTEFIFAEQERQADGRPPSPNVQEPRQQPERSVATHGDSKTMITRAT